VEVLEKPRDALSVEIAEEREAVLEGIDRLTGLWPSPGA
jgi:hypothetical protein